MALTDTAIRNLKSEPEPYKKSDSEGLYLLVTPEGSRLWHLAYRFAGKQKTLALGPYPVVTLAMAREARVEAKRMLAQGVDPSEKRKADRRAAAAARTFGEVADEWFDTKREPEEKSEATLKRDRWLKGEWWSEGERLEHLHKQIEPALEANEQLGMSLTVAATPSSCWQICWYHLSRPRNINVETGT
jgi:Arm DNA-binding domain